MKRFVQFLRAKQVFTVVDVNDSVVRLDGNHPLAGVNLNFAVTVVGVRDATQEELDELETFYVTEDEPHVLEDVGGRSFRRRIVNRGETITREHLDVAGIPQADDAGEFDIFLPSGIVTRVDKPSHCPAWLPAQIIEQPVAITVSAAEQRLAGYFTWHEAKHEADCEAHRFSRIFHKISEKICVYPCKSVSHSCFR